jgi:aminopeptidase N
MKITWLLGAIMTLLALPLCADTYPRQPLVDAQHYSFRLTLLTDDSNANQNEIQGEATVTLRVLDDNVRKLFLDLTSVTANGKGMKVTGVTSSGQAVVFTHSANRLQLPVSTKVKAGQDITFVISYRGSPGNGLRLRNNIHGDRTAFSENWYNNARQWLPTIDHPYDKATDEFIITTKADYQVIGNGALIEQLDLPGGLRRTHWKQSVPIASWLYSIGVARFIVQQGGIVRGVPLSYWAFPQDAEKGLAALKQGSRESFEFFSDRIAPYPYAKLAHVEAAGIGGATEHATNIFYGEDSVTLGNAPTVHETAHQWFGNSVTEHDWNDVWLSEGFATYLALLYFEHANGRDDFVEGVRSSRDLVLQFEKEQTNTPLVHVNLNESNESPLNTLVYEKGAWTLHMLRNLIGTEIFWQGIREYYQRHMNGHASSDDFRHMMERVSGRDLSWFFQQWLNRSGVPVVGGSWRYDAQAKQILVTIKQTQTAEPYRFSLDIGISTTANTPPKVFQMQVSGRDAEAAFPADSEPVSVVLDPNVWLLAEFGELTKL